MSTRVLPDSYFAGFFDADGSVSIDRGVATTHYICKSCVTNTNQDVLLKFKERFGGTVMGPYSRGENCKPIYHWKLDAKKSLPFFLAVVPYLTVKRERVELAIQFREMFEGENILPRGKSANMFPEKVNKIMAGRKEFYDQMKLLNKRGI